MPRLARMVIPGVPHHITQRGNNRQDVFFVEDDRRVYLSLLQEQSRRYGLQLLGYCLMSNHVHLIATPARDDSLAKAVGRGHWLYTQYVNRLHGRSGHLWQNRFYSCALDEEHLVLAMAYIERNPVRAKIVRQAWRYHWSSAAAHVSGRDESGVLDPTWSKNFLSGPDWREFLTRPEDDQTRAGFRLHTSRGRPLASDAFLSKVEKTLGRRLRPLPVGRPRKESEVNR